MRFNGYDEALIHVTGMVPSKHYCLSGIATTVLSDCL